MSGRQSPSGGDRPGRRDRNALVVRATLAGIMATRAATGEPAVNPPSGSSSAGANDAATGDVAPPVAPPPVAPPPVAPPPVAPLPPRRWTFRGLPEADYPARGYGVVQPNGVAIPPRFAAPEPLEDREEKRKSLGPDAYRHDGFFLRLGAAITYSTGHEPADPDAVIDPPTVPRRGHDPTGFGYEMLFGGTPWSGVVLGGGFMLTGEESRFPLATYAFFAQFYPEPTKGLHAQVLGAFSIYAGGDRRFGPSGAIGAGYDAWVGRQTAVGAFLRVGYANLVPTDYDQSRGSLIVMAEGTFTWH